jgi:hypothetical protein
MILPYFYIDIRNFFEFYFHSKALKSNRFDYFEYETIIVSFRLIVKLKIKIFLMLKGNIE